MKALKIIDCRDCLMWYRNHVGHIVPYLREYTDEYMSREPAGYSNIVKTHDAIVVEIEENFTGYYK